jgi:hypothetical protein
VFKGYLSFGGREIVNAARTAAYMHNLDAPIPFEHVIECDSLPVALGHAPYTSPLADDAPWFDPNNAATGRFYGLYPLDVQGWEDDTATAETVESIVEGGSVGQERRGTRPIRVTAAMFAADDAAMTAGMAWLRAALEPSSCNQHGAGTCGGAQLCVFTACPDVERCWEPTYQAGYGRPIALTTPESSPTIFQEESLESIWKANLHLTGANEGVILEWGAVDQAQTSRLVEKHGPVILKRTNHVLVPSFENGNVGGWWTTDGVGTAAYGAPFENRIALERTSVDPVATYSGNLTGHAGSSVVSFSLHSLGDPDDVIVRLRQTDGDAIVAEGSFDLGDSWTRYSFTAPLSSDTYLEFITTGVVYIADVVVEAGLTPLPFFNGDTAPEVANAGYVSSRIPASEQYAIAWEGAPFASRSTSTYIADLWVGGTFDGPGTAGENAGLCDAYPWLNVLQGAVQGDLVIALRLPIQLEERVAPYERTFHDVKRVQGPLVISEQKTSRGGIIRTVEFTLVAGKPAAYSTPRGLMFETLMSSLPTVPWYAIDCSEPQPISIIDPDCPPVPAPPLPPAVPNACVTTETVWQRYWLTIPAESVSAWSKTATQVTIRSGIEPIRQVRVRAYPNPFDAEPVTGEDYRYNLAHDPAVDVGGSIWGITAASNGTGARVAISDPPVEGIEWAYRVTATAAHTATSFGPKHSDPDAIPVIAGQQHAFSIYGRASTARSIGIRVAFYDDDGDPVGTTATYNITAVAAGAWERLETVLTPPVGATYAEAGVVGSGTSPAIGDWIEATGLLVEVGNVHGEYFDGFRSPTGYYAAWLGAQGGSISASMSFGIDPCSYCSEFIVSYLPAQTELTVDAILERAFASIEGAPSAQANHLLYSGDGAPMVWPELSCGNGYLIAIDVPEPLLDDVYVSVSTATKE